MTQPTSYSPTTDFSEEEVDGVSGRSTVRTPALDVEFANIATTLAAVLTNLSVIQRDDTGLRDLIVEPYTLSAATLALIGSAGFTVSGAWLTATVYPARTIVTNGTGTYVSASAHTSGVFATDLAAGKWVRLFDTAAYVASGITFTPTGTIAATNAQSAIAEVASEAVQKSANGADFASIPSTRTNLSVPSIANVQASSSIIGTAGGGVDAITATFTPTITAWANGLLLIVECAGANATTTPTFNPDGIGAKTIVRPDGSALLAGDIPGANFRALFVYDASLDKVLLLNTAFQGPAVGAAGTALTSNGPGTQPSFQSTNAVSVMNRAINGCFRLDQINEGAAYTVNSAGPTQLVDQFSGFGIGAAGVFTATKEADPDYPGEYNLLLACTTADAAIAAGDLYGVHTDLEGYNVADFQIGTANAKQITIQFEAKCTLVGTYGISVVNSAVNRSYVGTFTVNAANTVEAKSVTLTLDTTGTWLKTNGTGMRVRICLAAGTTYQGSSGAWTGSNLYTTSAQANFMAVNTNTMRLKRFQVVQASSAIAFDRRSIQQELALCQRYYEKTFDIGTAVAQASGVYQGCVFGYVPVGDTVVQGGSYRYKVSKRAVPTVTFYNPTQANGNYRTLANTLDATISTGSGTPGLDAISFYGNGGTSQQTYGVHVTANARLS